MSAANPSATFPELRFRPLTTDRLADLARFSEAHGRFRYCSCMRWRMRSSEFSRSSREERARALEALVREGTPVGVLAYDGTEPIAWCSVAPRETYARLEGYRGLPRIDDAAVWSVVCFFVDRRYRRRGVASQLIRAAVDYALTAGAEAIEGYPVEPEAHSYAFMGFPSLFERVGFRDVTPPGQARRVMRFVPAQRELSSRGRGRR